MIRGRIPWGTLSAGFMAIWASLILGALSANANRALDPPEAFTQFSGRVYSGPIGDETIPLEGVTVELYCSANHAVLGSLITTTTTDSTGWYGLATVAICEYYNILEIDLPEFQSEGATSVDGEVINEHWIEYTSPVGGLTLTGNKFWDREIDPAPGGWTGFWPVGWVTNRILTSGIQVMDAGSGLDPSTAEYSFTSDGGASWSPWLSAECIATPGSHDPETITAHDVEFSADAGIDHLTWIRFRISDLAGHPGISDDHPVEIDSIPPDSSVLELDPCFGVTAFLVSWAADQAGGSPIASYDIWVEDHLDGATVAEYEWQSDTDITTADFSGELGHDYSFSARARDEAGNQEDYPPFADASTSVGCDLTIEVRDQGGALRPNAKVYFNGDFLGSTDGVGSIVAPKVMLGDELLAISLEHEEPSFKPHHGTLGNSNWAYKVYLTSFPLAADGTPLLHVVTDLTTIQTLTVRPDQALVGFHVLVSVEHDAKPAYMTTMRQRLESATSFLYDVGDGQFFFDVIEIRDDSVFRGDSDIKIQASKTNEAWAHLGGVTGPSNRQIRMSRNKDGRVMIHEWGHYGLWLWDEYLNPAGRNTVDSYCSTNLMVPPEENRASIMHDDSKTSELCSRVDPTHAHRTNTQHDHLSNGETTWETVDRVYSDSSAATPSWGILTPDERGARMAGPGAAPADWTTIVVVDTDTGSCEPFLVIVRNASGKGELAASVGLDRTAHPGIFQGWTNMWGGLNVVGAHVGDRLWATSKDGGYASKILTNCSDFTIDLGYPANPSALEYEVAPLAHDMIEVRIRPRIPLTGHPVVDLWQEGAPAPIPIVLIWDPVPEEYVGQAGLAVEHEQAGVITIEATPEGRTDEIFRRAEFRMNQVIAELHTPRIYAARGDFELVLPANSLTTDAAITIQTEVEVGPPPPGLSRLSPAYRCSLSTDQQTLLQPAVITIRFDDDLLSNAAADSLEIFWWDPDAETWVSADADVFPENTLATADVTELRTVALMGRTGGIFLDGFEDGSTTAWSSTVP